MVESIDPTIPSTIEEELETNPFMRVDLSAVQITHCIHEPIAFIEREQ